MPAKDSFPSMGLRVSCLTCASGLLAAKVSRGAGLRASDGVRMVWRGFRALKTPERASYLPTLQRRLPDAALRLHSSCIPTAEILQLRPTYCTNPAEILLNRTNGSRN